MSSESSEVLSCPWISKAFFEHILRREHKDDGIVVQDYTLKSALGTCENFGSQMFRVRVNYSSTKNPSVNHISLLVKAAIAHNTTITVELGLFHKEIYMYHKIIPEVEKLLRSIGDHSRLAAKCYDACEKQLYLVFEDLSASGYVNVNRRNGFDVEHFNIVLMKTAKLHAATAILLNESPSIAKTNQDCLLLTDYAKPLIRNAFLALQDAVKEIPGSEHLSPKLECLSELIRQKIANAIKYDVDALNVFLHGDLWANNVMFKYDTVTGRPSDAILVDFQGSFVGSPVLDVVHTFFTSSSESVQAREWDTIFGHYHCELVRLLKEFRYAKPVPALAELQVDRLNRSHYSATIGMYMLAVRNSEKNLFLSTRTASHSDRVQAILNLKIRKALEFLLHFCNDNGLFEV